MTRLEGLGVVVDCLPDDTAYVATTGYTGRELAEIRMKKIGDALASLALEEERVAQFEIAIDEYHKVPQIINDFVEMVEDLGPNPFKGF